LGYIDLLNSQIPSCTSEEWNLLSGRMGGSGMKITFFSSSKLLGQLISWLTIPLEWYGVL